MDNILKKHERKVSSINKTIKKRTKINENYNKDIITLHKEKLEYFKKLQTIILPKKIKELQNTHIEYLKKTLQNEIENIKTYQEETSYYFKVTDIITNYEKSQDEKEKEELTLKYYSLCGLNYIVKKEKENIDSIYFCNNCQTYDNYETEEGLVCPKCGIVSGVCIDANPTYNDICEGKGIMVKKIIYSRMNYFCDLLKKIQSINNRKLPDDLLNLVKKELFILNIKQSNQVTIPLIRKILKKLNYSNHYNDVQYIICTINNKKTLTIPKPVEDILKHMFEVIQDPWEILIKNETRRNFFSYPYVLYKFFQILELNEYLPFLTLLKDEKLGQHEALWKKIMEYINDYELDRLYPFKINWRFIPI